MFSPSMWSSLKYLIGVISVIQLHFSNALDIDVHSDTCIATILSCDWYRQPFSLYKEKDIGMFTNIEDLNKACKEQTAYTRCIVRAENFCKKAIFSPMAKEMIKSRRFSAEICRPASPWQQLYLREASCLNAYSKKAFVYCVDKINGIGNSDPDNTFEPGCKYGTAIIDCSAAALQEKCGYYAGNILKKFLKFHSLSDYKCSDFKPEDDYALGSKPDDITEAIFNVLEAAISSTDFDTTEGIEEVNSNSEETKLDHLEDQISLGDLPSKEEFTIFEFENPLADQSSMTTEYFFPDMDSDAESQDVVMERDELGFPALPKYNYIHKNSTTFALYEDSEMGHMKYIGCGEADFFWIILSPLNHKYCSLTDLKSEYSEILFKCTVRIDAPCTPEINDEDINLNAEVFHRRYVVTVLTPPNNRLSENMAIMNVRYIKFYPYQPRYVPEKKVNLWTSEANKATIKQTESVGRKGTLEFENDRSDILYHHGNGSGQKLDKAIMKHETQSDEDESFDEYENWDYYPLEKEDSVYFPELLTNNIIYIEDDKGDLISLHDHRSPIYSKSLYKPHSLFRPRTGVMPDSTDQQHFDEIGANGEKKLDQSSVSKERLSQFEQEALVSEVEHDQQEYCSAEKPCAPNSKFISEYGIKLGMHTLSQNIETFDPFKGQILHPIPASTKLADGIYVNSYLDSWEVYVVTPSAEIEVPKSTYSSQIELHEYEFDTDRSLYSPEDEDCNIGYYHIVPHRAESGLVISLRLFQILIILHLIEWKHSMNLSSMPLLGL